MTQNFPLICISGSSLFTLPRTGEGDPPLGSFAESGMLRVLMPKSTADNPTIKHRYSEYRTEFRRRNYPAIDDLIKEIEHNKRFVRMNDRNVVIEHDQLLMWRLVLLSHRCIVQNYFPNHTGEDSDDSPIFVFERTSAKCRYSYYSSFYRMFHLISGIPVDDLLPQPPEEDD
jgi:hypothetical protein